VSKFRLLVLPTVTSNEILLLFCLFVLWNKLFNKNSFHGFPSKVHYLIELILSFVYFSSFYLHISYYIIPMLDLIENLSLNWYCSLSTIGSIPWNYQNYICIPPWLIDHCHIYVKPFNIYKFWNKRHKWTIMFEPR